MAAEYPKQQPVWMSGAEFSMGRIFNAGMLALRLTDMVSLKLLYNEQERRHPDEKTDGCGFVPAADRWIRGG